MKFGVRYEQSWATACDPLLPFAFRQLMTALIAIAVFLKTREGETGCLILGSLRRRLIS